MFSSRAILAIGCELSMTILIASSRNSGENFLRCSGIGLLRSGLRSYWVPVRNLRGSPESLVLCACCDEGGEGEVVDAARFSAAVDVDEVDRVVGEQGVGAAGEGEVVTDVAGGLVGVHAGHVVSDGDALLEGGEDAEPHLGREGGLAE